MKYQSRDEFLSGLDYKETISLLQRRIRKIKPKKPKKDKNKENNTKNKRFRKIEPEEELVLDDETRQRLGQLQAMLFDMINASTTAKYYYDPGGRWRDGYCCLSRIKVRGNKKPRYILCHDE